MQFLQRRWEEDSVVYVIGSGETHLLSPAGSYLLERLESGPMPFQALVDEFLSLSDDLDQEEVAELLMEIIQSIHKIGLIESVEKLPCG